MDTAPVSSDRRPVHHWRQVPPAGGGTGLPPLVLWLLVGVPAISVLDQWSVQPGERRWFFVVIAVVIWAARRWPHRLVVVFALAMVAFHAVVPPSIVPRLALLSLVPLVVWGLGCGTFELRTRWWPPPTARPATLPPVAVLAVGLVVADAYRVAQVMAVVALVVAAVGIVAPAPVTSAAQVIQRLTGPVRGVGADVGHWLGTAGHAAGRLVGALVMVPVGVVLAVASGIDRAVGYDRLDSFGRGWVVRRRGDGEVARLFSDARLLDGRTRSAQRRGLVASAALVLGVVGAALVVTGLAPPGSERAGRVLQQAVGGRCPQDPDAAFDDDPGWPAVVCETEEFSINGRFDAVTTYKMADYDGVHLDVRGGVRAAWAPPPCSCERVEVWLFGGSAAFGWWQTTDSTIASQLARRAWAEGIALDIEVRAMPGWSLGQEARLFDELLSTDRPPDLAIFYDGGNELALQAERAKVGRGADESAASHAEGEIDRLLATGPFLWRPDGAEPVATSALARDVPPVEVARHAMARYLRDKSRAERAAASLEVPVAFVWQPLAVTSPISTSTADAMDPADRRRWTAMAGAAVAELPDDVVDLSNVFAQHDQPVFRDVFHHDASGAAMVASALFAELEVQLQALAQG